MRAAKRALLLTCLFGVSPGLAGCVSMRGAPERVFTPAQSLDLAGEYPYDQAIKAFFSDDSRHRGGLTPQQWRDMVVTVYLNAMDSQYSEFRAALSSEGRQAALGLDLAVIGFTGWASVAKDTMAKKLSAAAAAFAGARGVVDKTLYFDKSLPALLSAMDAQRLRTKTQIMVNLRKSASDYPLPTAFAELMSYEITATLDSAVEQVTQQASETKKIAQAEYDNAVKACPAQKDAAVVAQKLADYAYDLADTTSGPVSLANLMKLRLVATAMGQSPSGNADELLDTITDHIVAEGCKKAELDGWITKVEGLTGDDL
jgi:hypothetical protein